MSARVRLVVRAFWGLALGYVISRIGFADYGEVQRMFRLEDLRMFLSFASGTAIVALYFLAAGGFRVVAQSPVHPGVVPGSIMFGAGWALTGACPAVILLQMSHGYSGALVTLAGVAAGMVAYREVHRRYFRWPAASCEA